MRISIIILTLFTLTTSCSSNYDNAKYWDEENKAILDLIPEMVEADYMLKHNDYWTKTPTLYIITDLYNDLLTVESQNAEISKDDKKQLAPLIKKQISNRKLPSILFDRMDNIHVQTLTLEEFEKKHLDNLVENVERERLLGYLVISRIIFTDDYKKGYISFQYFCGEACAWNSVIEIKNINGRWTKSRYICGGIA